MQTYLVGGAVRDELLGEPVQDRDWVVVGAQPDALIAQGYRPVGQDFPVFLHPKTNEAYALARTERKTAKGYHGFHFHTGPEVTLEQDLARRDLTINAMAKDSDGQLIDPYGGARDLEAKILRHVSPSFSEDPVRVLRVARFAARYAKRGFVVAAETRQLMVAMVDAGEVDALVAERVWQELSRALTEKQPSAFITTLRDCGALARVLPEVEALFGVPQRADYHPEIDTGKHILLVIDQAAAIGATGEVVFAALVHDLGKALTPEQRLPSHPGHESAGLPLVQALCRRLNAPKSYQRLAKRVCRYHLDCHRALELRPKTILRLFEKIDGFRRPQELEAFLQACEADSRGRDGFADSPYPQAQFLRQTHAAASAVEVQELIKQGFTGQALGQAIRRARIKAIAQVPKPEPN